ncbi:MFS transporter [Quadrisphaera sp. DSM 44207]|uniref:MFS transporter n=1 Tax=Quadrisphaera sp. DSM 44207 TaxID=1881057 RepID=UPI000B84D9DA|nr:MFS transporter [Quadrisphaera sp. DSM 44207]
MRLATPVLRRDSSSPVLRRQRAAVSLLFALMGATTGSWAARIPDVREQVSLDDARWGLATTASTGGSLLSLVLVAVVIARVGPRRLTRLAAPLLLINAPLLASAHHPVPLVAGLVVQGFATNLLSTPMNAQAVQVERAAGRPVLSTFHACFSLGQLAGGLAGVVAASAGLVPAVQLAATGAVLGMLLAVTARWQPPDDVVPAHERTRLRVTPQLALLAGIALLAALVEGTTVQWSAVYAADALGAGAAAGAAALACFSLAMVVGRLVGDRVVERLGRARSIRASAVLTACGLALALGVGTPLAAGAGFALVGLGSACVVPTVFGLAGNQPGTAPGQGVAVAALGMWPAFLLGPPLVGALAGLAGLRSALWLLVVAAAGIAVLAGRVRPPAPGSDDGTGRARAAEVGAEAGVGTEVGVGTEAGVGSEAGVGAGAVRR